MVRTRTRDLLEPVASKGGGIKWELHHGKTIRKIEIEPKPGIALPAFAEIATAERSVSRDFNKIEWLRREYGAYVVARIVLVQLSRQASGEFQFNVDKGAKSRAPSRPAHSRHGRRQYNIELGQGRAHSRQPHSHHTCNRSTWFDETGRLKCPFLRAISWPQWCPPMDPVPFAVGCTIGNQLQDRTAKILQGSWQEFGLTHHHSTKINPAERGSAFSARRRRSSVISFGP